MLTIELNRKQLKSLLNVAGKKDIRYYLNGVCIQIGNTEARMIATNGSMLGMFRVTLPEPTGLTVLVSVIIPRKVIKAIEANKYLNVITLQIDDNPATGAIIDAGVPRTFTFLDGRFPDYARVIPSKCDGTAASYNPHYVMAFAKLAKECGYAKMPPSFAQNGLSSALITHGNIPELVGVLMPMRYEPIAEAPAWATAPLEVASNIAAA